MDSASILSAVNVKFSSVLKETAGNSITALKEAIIR
jgi:hypothetical protein